MSAKIQQILIATVIATIAVALFSYAISTGNVGSPF